MGQGITIDPVTRIGGHLRIEVEVEAGKVVEAKSSVTMFRGIELILKGRDPGDAQYITQRVCGVCSSAHSQAAVLALEDAFNVVPPPNGRILRNLIQGTNLIQSHILHFYHLTLLDYVVGPDTVPFIPKHKADYRLQEDVNRMAVEHYIKALDMRKKAHETLAIFGGKVPHEMSKVPGGVTVRPTVDKIVSFTWRLKELIDFIENIYLPDVIAIAKAYADYFDIGAGCKNLLAYGAFELDEKKDGNKLLAGRTYIEDIDNEFNPEKIKEQVRYSWYTEKCGGRNPRDGLTELQPEKTGAYSWIKAARYDGKVFEVGPLARIFINRAKDSALTDTFNSLGIPLTKAFSVMGRHIARALECLKVAKAMESWVAQLDPTKPVCTPVKITEPEIWYDGGGTSGSRPNPVPESKVGMGLTEAPAGALGHWLEISEGKIAKYQIVTPTNWNASPKDDKDQPGPIEQALLGIPVKDTNNPIELLRVVRSFDPCMTC